MQEQISQSKTMNGSNMLETARERKIRNPVIGECVILQRRI